MLHDNQYNRFIVILTALLFMVPFLGALIIITQQQNADIIITQKEIDGAHYHKLLFALQDTLIQQALNVDDSKSAIKERLQDIERRADLARSLNLYERWGTLSDQINETLKNSSDPLQYEKNRQDLSIFMKDVSNVSALILDPKTESYYIIYVITRLIPDAADTLGSLGLIVHDTNKYNHHIAHILIAQNKRIELFQTDYNYADRIIQHHDSERIAALVPKQTGLQKTLDFVLAQNDQIIASDQGIKQKEAYIKTLLDAQSGFMSAYKLYHDHLVWHLEQRLKHQKSQQLNVLIALAFSFAMAVIIFLYARHNYINRKAVEKALYIQTLLDAISRFHAIIEFDKEGKILDANQNFLNVTGYKIDEIVGKKHDIFLRPEDKNSAQYHQHWSDLNEGKQVSGEYRRIDHSGQDVWIYGLYTPITNPRGEVTRIVKFVLDITDRKRNEQNLQQSTARLNAILDNTVEGLITINEDGIIESYNQACAEIFGYSESEALGQNVKMLMLPDDRSQHDQYLDNYKKTNHKTIIGIGRTVQARRKNGSDFWIELSVSEIFLDGRRIFSGIIRDITQRLETEEKVQAYTIELELARLQADSANRLKSEFLATMSHEIRTPMNGIMGMTDLLSETELNDKQKNYVSTIMRSAETLMTLLDDILDFSKIEAGKIELEHVPFNLEHLINDVVALMMPRASHKGIEIRCESQKDMPTHLIGDPTRIRQILLNLLSNAIKFTERGHVIVHTEHEDDGSLSPEAVMIKISVQDTGIGIPAEAQGRLFDKFTQADSSTTRKFGGSGLGLAICKKLVEMMKGTIHLQSTLGFGSTFTCVMLLQRGSHQEKSKSTPTSHITPSSQAAAFKGRRVLLAEDNDINQQFAREILEAEGCIVDLAPNGRVALMLATAHDYDLIFMDCEMPELDGLTVTVSIREHERQHHKKPVPIIALTAHAMAGDREKCLAAGMDDYLTKPLRRQQLRDVLARWMTTQA